MTSCQSDAKLSLTVNSYSLDNHCMNIKVLVGFLLVLVLWDSVNCQAVPDDARPLPLTAVRITGGPLRHAQDLDRAYLPRLEPDRMMAYYRKRAGLQPKAQGYPGWDGDGRNLTGHIAGHYLSAVSLMFAEIGSHDGVLPQARRIATESTGLSRLGRRRQKSYRSHRRPLSLGRVVDVCRDRIA